jgi:cell division septation protein DedD
MSAEEVMHHTQDDQSHYEISLTAGQAFVAFVLLLLSLAASFAFGLMIGRGQADERLVVRKEPAVINEGAAPVKKDGRIVELGVTNDEFKAPATESTADASAPLQPDDAMITEEPAAKPDAAPTLASAVPAAATPEPAATAPTAAMPTAAMPAVTHYAQLLSSGDQKAAETLAAKLIDRGFTNAYVERGANEKGPLYRVRVKFPSEADARAAKTKLEEFSKDVWITKQ